MRIGPRTRSLRMSVLSTCVCPDFSIFFQLSVATTAAQTQNCSSNDKDGDGITGTSRLVCSGADCAVVSAVVASSTEEAAAGRAKGPSQVLRRSLVLAAAAPAPAPAPDGNSPSNLLRISYMQSMVISRATTASHTLVMTYVTRLL